MKKLSLIFLLLGLGMSVAYVSFEYKEYQRQKYNFYQITCGSGMDEVQYIATKELEGKYYVDGEYREFKGCQVQLVEPKN